MVSQQAFKVSNYNMQQYQIRLFRLDFELETNKDATKLKLKVLINDI